MQELSSSVPAESVAAPLDQAASGAFWTAALFFLQKAFSVTANVVLARLLFPKDFGLVGVAWLFIGAISIFQFMGLGAALVHRQKSVREAYDVAFWVAMLVGVVLFAVSWLGAPLAGRFFRMTEATTVIRLLSFSFILGAAGQMPTTILMKEMEFSRKFAAEMVGTVATGVVSIVLAVADYGALSLVYGALIGNMLNVAISWPLVEYRPRLAFDPKIARELFSYGKYALGAGWATYALMNIDYLIVGRSLGATDLGLYTQAFTTISFSWLGVLFVTDRVVFPLFARIQDDTELLQRTLLRATRFSLGTGLPLGVFLAIAAPAVVRAVYGPKWLGAIPVMRFLIGLVVLRLFVSVFDEFFKAVGRPHTVFNISLVWLACLVPVMLVFKEFGLVGIGLAHTVVAIPVLILYAVSVSRASQIPLARLWAAVWPVMAGAAVMGGLVKLMLNNLDHIGHSRQAAVGSFTAGMLVYGLIVYLLDKEIVADIQKFISPSILRRSP